MAEPAQEVGVQALRRFNRFYARRLGALEQGLPGAGLALAEARLLSEIAQRERPTAAVLARELLLDPGYVSRTVAGLEQRRLIRRARSTEDARQSLLALTDAGETLFATLDARTNAALGALVAPLADEERRQLSAALARIESLLGETAHDAAAYLLRPHRPGDMGWIIRRHAELYHQEFGWDASFEGFVAEIGAAFLKSYDPARDCCWIAECHGETIGSACLVKVSQDSAKLRLLLVEPSARGRGIGRRLVEECIAFARHAGYGRITLWSNDILHAAQRIFERTGFRLTGEESYRRFGKTLVGQSWECQL